MNWWKRLVEKLRKFIKDAANDNDQMQKGQKPSCCDKEGKMFKQIFLFFVAGSLIFGVNKASPAMMCGSDSGHTKHAPVARAEHEHGTREAAKGTASEDAVNVGNKICPVSGEKIDEKVKATYEYQGKIYNFCCAGCMDEFKEGPEEYIEKVNEELNSESEAESGEDMMVPEPEMPEGAHDSGHQHHGAH